MQWPAANGKIIKPMDGVHNGMEYVKKYMQYGEQKNVHKNEAKEEK